MMSLLYYWRPDNYARDRAFGFGYHLNQDSPAMGAAEPGGSLWAFTRRRDGRYVLAAELVVRAVTRNPPNYRYGRFRIWGDLERSRYFDIDRGPRIDPLVRALSVPARAEALGRSFQGHAAVRPLTADDHRLLAAAARDLPGLDRVGIYPEDALEARLVQEDATPLMIEEGDATASRRLAYLYRSVDPQRLRRHVAQPQALYAGRCQLSGYDPLAAYGHRLCHGHHIAWLCRGGEDTLENLLLVCPNHHAALHRDDAPFDYRTLAFAFSSGQVEPVRWNEHLAAAV